MAQNKPPCFPFQPVQHKSVVTTFSEEVISLQVIVVVNKDVAYAFQLKVPPTAESQKLRRILENAEVTLEPLHPGIQDPELIRYFKVEVSNSETAQNMISLLQQSPAIEAAYVKPPDEMP